MTSQAGKKDPALVYSDGVPELCIIFFESDLVSRYNLSDRNLNATSVRLYSYKNKIGRLAWEKG